MADHADDSAKESGSFTLLMSCNTPLQIVHRTNYDPPIPQPSQLRNLSNLSPSGGIYTLESYMAMNF